MGVGCKYRWCLCTAELVGVGCASSDGVGIQLNCWVWDVSSDGVDAQLNWIVWGVFVFLVF